MKKLAKKEEGKGVSEQDYRKLISDAIPGLDKIYLLGTMLSKSEKPDAAYAGKVIEEIVGIIGREFCSVVPDLDSHQFDPDFEIPF